MYKEDLALNNRQGWYAIKPNQTNRIHTDNTLMIYNLFTSA